MAHTAGIAHRASCFLEEFTICPQFRRVGGAFTAASGIALLAFRYRLLSKSGAAMASTIGGAVFAGTGVGGSITLLSYFLTSSLLGRLPRAQKFSQRRGNQRDATQVLANGGIPALIAAFHHGASGQRRATLSLAFSSAVAAAAADTWATEIGSRFGGYPRSIITGHHVPPGASGGVSLTGLTAAAAGSAFVAATSLPGDAIRDTGMSQTRMFLAISVAGVAGSIVDSVLGASLQEVRYCEFCSTDSEQLVHDCGNETSHSHGISGWNNDVTNVLGILAGAFVGPTLLVLVSDRTSGVTTSNVRLLRS